MITVDWYVCGVYRGKRDISESSMVGSLLAGDTKQGEAAMGDMKRELEALGCKVGFGAPNAEGATK